MFIIEKSSEVILTYLTSRTQTPHSPLYYQFARSFYVLHFQSLGFDYCKILNSFERERRRLICTKNKIELR